MRRCAREQSGAVLNDCTHAAGVGFDDDLSTNGRPVGDDFDISTRPVIPDVSGVQPYRSAAEPPARAQRIVDILRQRHCVIGERGAQSSRGCDGSETDGLFSYLSKALFFTLACIRKILWPTFARKMNWFRC